MCLASVAWAREDSVAEKELATVVVTASRLQELEREALSATTVISSQAIRNRRLADLQSVLRSEAGIEFDRMGGPGMVTSVFMRGSNANRVLVQLDGVPVTDGAVVCRSNVQYTGERVDGSHRLPAYWLASLDVRYRISREVSVYGRIENLFDKDYETVYGYNQPGRGIYVGVNLTM